MPSGGETAGAAVKKERPGRETSRAFSLGAGPGFPGPVKGRGAEKVFAGAAGEQVAPDPRDREGFDRYLERYRACLPAEKLLGQR